ncbi:MAG: methyltransferase domain-containing protein [Solirubrobacterales bacterium]|nr:methyltransferase domain-containing protein [Solirubrobacterales bacterium]
MRRLLRAFRVRLAALLDHASRRVFPEAEGPADMWQRTMMNEAIEAELRELKPAELDAAEISGAGRASLGWRSFTSLDYPEFDLCAPLETGERFDVVVCEQVLEHVVDPNAAARNLRGLCRPGGLVVVSTPFLIRVHELPMFGMYDYWRFTPRGLRTLLEGAGLEVESVGSWGNAEAVLGNLHRWSSLRRWHPMHNEPDLPVQVWAFARNPS